MIHVLQVVNAAKNCIHIVILNTRRILHKQVTRINTVFEIEMTPPQQWRGRKGKNREIKTRKEMEKQKEGEERRGGEEEERIKIDYRGSWGFSKAPSLTEPIK